MERRPSFRTLEDLKRRLQNIQLSPTRYQQEQQHQHQQQERGKSSPSPASPGSSPQRNDTASQHGDNATQQGPTLGTVRQLLAETAHAATESDQHNRDHAGAATATATRGAPSSSTHGSEASHNPDQLSASQRDKHVQFANGADSIGMEHALPESSQHAPAAKGGGDRHDGTRSSGAGHAPSTVSGNSLDAVDGDTVATPQRKASSPQHKHLSLSSSPLGISPLRQSLEALQRMHAEQQSRFAQLQAQHNTQMQDASSLVRGQYGQAASTSTPTGTTPRLNDKACSGNMGPMTASSSTIPMGESGYADTTAMSALTTDTDKAATSLTDKCEVLTVRVQSLEQELREAQDTAEESRRHADTAAAEMKRLAAEAGEAAHRAQESDQARAEAEQGLQELFAFEEERQHLLQELMAELAFYKDKSVELESTLRRSQRRTGGDTAVEGAAPGHGALYSHSDRHAEQPSGHKSRGRDDGEHTEAADTQQQRDKEADGALRAQIEELQQTVLQLERELQQTQRTRDRWRQECEATQAAMEELEKTAQESQERIKELQGQLADARAELADRRRVESDEMKQLHKDNEHMKKQILDLNADFRRVQSENKALKRQISNAQHQSHGASTPNTPVQQQQQQQRQQQQQDEIQPYQRAQRNLGVVALPRSPPLPQERSDDSQQTMPGPPAAMYEEVSGMRRRQWQIPSRPQPSIATTSGAPFQQQRREEVYEEERMLLARAAQRGDPMAQQLWQREQQLLQQQQRQQQQHAPRDEEEAVYARGDERILQQSMQQQQQANQPWGGARVNGTEEAGAATYRVGNAPAQDVYTPQQQQQQQQQQDQQRMHANDECDFNIFTGEPKAPKGGEKTKRNRMMPSTRMSWVDSPPRRSAPDTRISAYASEGFAWNVLGQGGPQTLRVEAMDEALERARLVRQGYS